MSNKAPRPRKKPKGYYKVFKLTRPIMVGDEEVNEIKLPAWIQLRDMKKLLPKLEGGKEGSELEMVLDVLAELADIPKSSVEDLAIEDMEAGSPLMKHITDFLESSAGSK